MSEAKLQCPGCPNRIKGLFPKDKEYLFIHWIDIEDKLCDTCLEIKYNLNSISIGCSECNRDGESGYIRSDVISLLRKIEKEL